jgi:hypothetical protein
MPTLILPRESWKTATPSITSDETNRTPELYLRVVDQFPVTTHERYRRGHAGGNETYCNIFCSDVTLAMNAPIPHWVDGGGNPCPVGKGTELSANGVIDWLVQHGPRYGWKVSGLKDALAYAQSGKPVVCAWRNVNGKPGHVAMMLPTTPGPRIAQAGGTNFFDKPMASGFGQLPVSLYVHE